MLGSNAVGRRVAVAVLWLAGACTEEGEGGGDASSQSDSRVEVPGSDGESPSEGDASSEEGDASSEDGGGAAVDAASDMDAQSSDGGGDATLAEAGPGSDGASSLDAGAATDATAGDASNAADGSLWSTSLPCGALGDLQASSGAIMDVGHGSAITGLTRSGNRLLSIDKLGHWVLWNLSTHSMLLRGGPVTAMNNALLLPQFTAGRLLVAVSSSTLELRSAETGALLTSISVTAPGTLRAPYGIAADGSYFWLATGTELRAWDATGNVLVDRAGNYASPSAKVYAAPGELRVGAGPAGANVVEKISTATGMSSSSASYTGTFTSWFLDGSRFFTAMSTTARIYSASTVQQEAIVSLDAYQLQGSGGRFWRTTPSGDSLSIYAVANPAAAPLVVTGQYAFAGDTLLLTRYDFGLQRAVVESIQLAQVGNPKTTQLLPKNSSPDVVAADPTGAWVVGDRLGVVIDGSAIDRPLSCGKPLSIRGSNQGRTTIVTPSGILVFELNPKQYLGRIAFTATDSEMSRDGNTLVATSTSFWLPIEPSTEVTAFDLPAGTINKTWIARYTGDNEPRFLYQLSLSENGQWLGFFIGVRQVINFATGAKNLDVPATFLGGIFRTDPLLQLSPSGARVAVPMGPLRQYSTVSDIYENGQLINSVPGYAVGWLDEERVVVAAFDPPPRGLDSVYRGMEVYDTLGVKRGTPALPLIYPSIRRMDGDRFYASRVFTTNTQGDTVLLQGVYNVSGGAAVWSGPGTDTGTTAGAYIVYSATAAPHEVIAARY